MACYINGEPTKHKRFFGFWSCGRENLPGGRVSRDGLKDENKNDTNGGKQADNSKTEGRVSHVE